MPTVSEAIAYAEKGLAVFPVWGIFDGQCGCNDPGCKSPGKHPITPQGFQDATTNIQTIKVWWAKYKGSNIGIATGELSGIIVLDVDGPEGLASLTDKTLPDTPTAVTGKGCHYYFKHPGWRVKNSVRRLGKGLDIRGDGGYVVAPPSRHASGVDYRWSTELDIDFAEIPAWIREAITPAAPGFDAVDDSDEEEIIEGLRNITLTSKAGAMHRQRFTAAEIRVALISLNNRVCRPPLEVEEIDKIIQSIGKKPNGPVIKFTAGIHDEILGDRAPTEECRTAPKTDVGNAEAFVSLYGEMFRYDNTRRKWMVWLDNVGVWREDYAQVAHRAMIATVRARKIAANFLPTPADQDALRKFCDGTERQHGIKLSLQHAATFRGISVESSEFDVDPSLLNFQNGILNLDSLEFIEADKTMMISRQTAVEFDPTAKAPRWEAFIREVFDGNEALALYVQRALGYCLSGKINEQAFFIAHGSGANGKSTLLNTVRKVLGDYSSTTAFSTFDADNRNQYGNDLAALKARRFVIAIEAEQSKRLAEARVKTVTGGEPVSCRFLYGEFFEMIPEFKVWLGVNHKPLIRGSDHGIWRRIHLIPFAITFGNNEDITEGKAKYLQDRNLEVKLADEYPGIMNWLIAGYKMWMDQGLNPPYSVQTATQEYKKENDSVALWLDERCSTGLDYTMPASEGYSDFRDFLTTTGEVERAIPAMRVWGLMMAEKGFEKTRREKGYVYLKVKVNPIKLTEGRGN